MHPCFEQRFKADFSPKGGIMKNYELNYILTSASTDETKDKTIEKINAFIEKNGGKVEVSEKVGNKRLAYEINKQKEGFYVLTNFSCETKLVKELDAFLNITENVIRHLIIAK